MTLVRGFLYENSTPEATAPYLLVVSEDDWNRVIPDGVAVPVFEFGDEQQESLLLVHVDGNLFADCTKVQTVDRDSWGGQYAAATPSVLAKVEAGLRTHLCINQLKSGTPSAAAKAPPPTGPKWWPHQGLVRYSTFLTDGQKKMYGVLTDDAWNQFGLWWTAIRLTSTTKKWRNRWEVTVTGGWVVSGDLYVLEAGELEATTPQPPRPARLTTTELAAIADRIETTLRTYPGRVM